MGRTKIDRTPHVTALTKAAGKRGKTRAELSERTKLAPGPLAIALKMAQEQGALYPVREGRSIRYAAS